MAASVPLFREAPYAGQGQRTGHILNLILRPWKRHYAVAASCGQPQDVSSLRALCPSIRRVNLFLFYQEVYEFSISRWTSLIPLACL